MAEKPSRGVVPVLVFHKISREQRYALTAGRFEEFIRLIHREGWYMVADYQYSRGDFTHVPSGMKPIVMGADDASYGNFVYKTYGDQLHGRVYRLLGRPIIEPDCMVGILERLARRENGRINFTFYLSFDAIPFRQLDAAFNPGFPYKGIALVEEKLHYLNENFLLGIHSLSHVYAYRMGAEAFARDVLQAWAIIDEYLNTPVQSVRTLAFPYGIERLTAEMRRKLQGIRYGEKSLEAAFDFDDKMAPAPGELRDKLKISRINVDNSSWDEVLQRLREADAVKSRRTFVLKTNKRKLPKRRYFKEAWPSDDIWIMTSSDF